MTEAFNILAVAQRGRLQYEALLLAASLRLSNPGFSGKLYLAEPQPGPRWGGEDTRIEPEVRALLTDLGAEILPFETQVFGASYPHGNKIEAIAHLPEAPFLFLDTDTLVYGDLLTLMFDFDKPSASMRRENTWPQSELYGPDLTQTWKSLYDRFGLDFESSLDRSWPENYWQHYLYFNAGWFFYRSPRAFGSRFLDWAREVRDNPPAELICQPLYPWLDQIVLPLVIHSFGGGRPGADLAGLDGEVTCHYRLLPMLYARESDAVVAMLERAAGMPAVKKLLKGHGPAKKMIYQGKGQLARAMFDRANLPRKEQMIRNRLKRDGLWAR